MTSNSSLNKRIHLIEASGTRLWMKDGSRLNDCSTWNESSCEYGIATTSALLRHSIPSNEKSLVVPRASNNQRFEQMHPLHWVLYRVLMSDYMGWKILTVPNSWFSQNKADAGGLRDLSDLQTDNMPIVLTNVDIPPTNSWSEYVKNVYFDEETSIALLYVWGDQVDHHVDLFESTLAMLDHIAKRNRENGCIQSESLYRDIYESNNIEYSRRCWIPTVIFQHPHSNQNGESYVYKEFTDRVAAHENPAAVLIFRKLRRGKEDDLERVYKQNNTWVVDTFEFPKLYSHHVFTISKDGSSITNVEILQKNMTNNQYKDDKWKEDTAYLRNLANEAIQNDPVIGQSTFMPLTRIRAIRRCMGGECEIGNLFNDAIRWKAGADVSFCNSGGVRGPGWEAGDVRFSDIWTALPFSNTICTGIFSGISLFKLMEYSISQATFKGTVTELGDRLLQVSGMRIVYNSELEGNRIISIDVWDKEAREFKPIERLKMYSFAAMNYLCFAKKPFPSFLGSELVLEGEKPASLTTIGVQESVAEYLAQLDKPYQAGIEGRLVNNTNIKQPLNLVQSEDSCPLDHYWDEPKFTCFRCFTASNIAFSSKGREFEVMYGEDVEGFTENLLVNRDSEDVLISPKMPPSWINLVGSSAGDLIVGGDPILLKSGTGMAVKYGVHSSKLTKSGTVQGAISFAITANGQQSGCLAKDSSFDVMVNISPESDLNQLGALRYTGFVLASMTILMSLSFGTWVWHARNIRAVSMMQPSFLLMICVGVVIMSSAMIPLSLDDGIISEQGCNIACNFTPWLISMGFTISFAALFSKLWRINKLIGRSAGFRRAVIRVKDVLLPFAVLFTFNFVFLLIFTLKSPLQWKRQKVPMQEWISYGLCTTNGSTTSMTMIVLLGGVNSGALILACHQAWLSRNLSQYSEARTLGVALYSWIQVILVGIPVTVLVDQDNVSAKYFINTSIIFGVSLSLLLIIFVPLLISYRKQQKNENNENNIGGRVKVTGLNNSKKKCKSSHTESVTFNNVDTEQPAAPSVSDAH